MTTRDLSRLIKADRMLQSEVDTARSNAPFGMVRSHMGSSSNPFERPAGVNALSEYDVADLFGTTQERMRTLVGALVDSVDWHFERIEGRERDNLILSALKRINWSELRSAGEHRANDWEDGWRENLNEFIGCDCDPEKLVPKYFKRNTPIRLNREYVLPRQSDFLYRYTQMFKEWLYKEYLADYQSVYEFGCGTGHNLVQLARLYPDKALYGLDWAKSSQEILRIVAERFTLNIKGGRFNFFDPDEAFTFDADSAILTFGALEQVGQNHGRYLDFILRRKPKLCVDVAGLHELYDEAYLLDYLALLYHRRRNYLTGYVARLQQLAAEGRVKIIKIHHQLCGNLYDDPHSYVIWKPL